MTDDFDFISNVKALSTNGTLIELLQRIENEATDRWKIAADVSEREECWHVLNGIQLLAMKIKSFTEEEKIREWNNQRVARRI